MRIAFAWAVVVLGVAVLASSALAGEPKPGGMTTVTCKAAPDQKYACYVPKAYTPKKQWPILYCFAPDARGDAFVTQYKNVCEERGWIVVGSLNSKNGPWEPIQAAIEAIWADTEARFSLSKKMRYASGFSGGARVSFALAEQQGEHFSGVIAIGAGLSSTSRNLPLHVAAWLMCGETCFNRPELDKLEKAFQAEKRSVHYENFPGAHVMPNTDLMEKAVRWMDDQAGEKKAERVRKALEEATAFREAGEPVKAWRLLVETERALPEATKAVKEMGKLRKALERDEAVKPEATAFKKLEAAEKWLKKNAARIVKSRSSRAQAEKKLDEVVEKHPDTWAAELAKARKAKLPPPKERPER